MFVLESLICVLENYLYQKRLYTSSGRIEGSTQLAKGLFSCKVIIEELDSSFLYENCHSKRVAIWSTTSQSNLSSSTTLSDGSMEQFPYLGY
jgi:hypothetical protein